MKKLWDIYFTFLKIGVVAFGGAYAILPILEERLVNEKKWLTKEELLDYFSVSQCAPGIISVNVAVFIAYRIKGVFGAILGALGMITSPFIIITVIAAFLQNFAEYEVVKNAFAGIRVCVCVLIVNSVISMWKKAIADKFTLVLFAAILILAVFTDISAIFLVIGAGAVGYAVHIMKEEKAK